MKTTIDISEPLFKETKQLAHKKGSTFKDIVEVALRLFLKTQPKGIQPFKLCKHSFRGKGLVEGLAEGNWSEIQRRVYEGRGG